MALLLSYYGDDFTGSTDVMEAMTLHGVKTVLFTRLPSPEERARFAGFQAVGLAGTSRSQTPDWMDRNLPEVFAWLQAQGARFAHYKVCSTFDSSPTVGSIGRAMDIARRIFRQRSTPLVVGAPQLKRYTAFGHLFSGYQGETYRIDRHPVMSRHPVTPMTEADLRLHLAKQTDTPVMLVPSIFSRPKTRARSSAPPSPTASSSSTCSMPQPSSKPDGGSSGWNSISGPSSPDRRASIMRWSVPWASRV